MNKIEEFQIEEGCHAQFGCHGTLKGGETPGISGRLRYSLSRIG